MNALTQVRLIWAAGAIQTGIVLVNGILPSRLRVRENVKGTPTFIRQIFYVHWIYIVLTVGFFSALCFGFAHDLAGTSRLGRFLSAFLAGFWLLRVALQWFYYDREVRRANRWLDALYLASLIALSFIFAWAVFAPVA
jgi:UDP-N-acetylmuramyl pentapeptide phosphotransferase/UDP-N-acetylglucosamine-1-phosphate transferase